MSRQGKRPKLFAKHEGTSGNEMGRKSAESHNEGTNANGQLCSSVRREHVAL